MPIGPTDEDVEAWAEQEHKRRQAWVSGPTEAEKQEWALRERRARARGSQAYGYGTPATAYGPTDEEVEAWAEEERKRRQAWLKGPTEGEKQEWARQERRRREREARSPGGLATPYGPTDEEVNEWAAQERERRQAWAKGPTEAEKQEWAAQVRARVARTGYRPGRRPYMWYEMEGPAVEAPWTEPWYEPYYDVPPGSPGAYGMWPGPAAAHRMRRDLELASLGAWSWLTDGPYWFWSHLTDAGRDWEEGFYRPGRRERISLYDY